MNYCIWKAMMTFLLDEHGLKTYTERFVAVSTDPQWLESYNNEMAKAKRLILDGVRDHVVSYIVVKNTTKLMWDALVALYGNPSENRKMFLKEKLRTTRMRREKALHPTSPRFRIFGMSLPQLEKQHKRLSWCV